MLVLKNANQIYKIANYPVSVREEVFKALKILDDCYGEDRDSFHDYGGYVAVIRENHEITQFEKITGLYLNESIPEYVDEVGKYVLILFLKSDDDAVYTVMPKEMMNNHLKKYITN